MRILVVSDSHGDVYSLETAIRMHREADVVAFLGDGESDFMEPQIQLLLQNKKVIAVKGNCDFGSNLPLEEVCMLGGQRVFALHGHSRMVKYGLESVMDAAKEKQASIILHGHTHIENSLYEDGIYLLCPGSIRNGSYGIVDITDKGVLCYTASIKGRGSL